MKTIIVTLSCVLLCYYAKAQYCTSEIRPDYKELITHVEDVNYTPCQNQSRKAWFYVQQQRLENRMEKLLKVNKHQTQSLAAVYVDTIEKWRYWDYKSPEQFKKGVTFLFNIDRVMDDIELGRSKLE